MAEETPVEGYLTITPGGPDMPTLGPSGSSAAQSYFAQKAKDDAATGSPPLAAADPAPPIGLRDSRKGKIIAIAPDVKFVGARGQNPTPFITRAYTDDQPEHYSPDVRHEGDRAGGGAGRHAQRMAGFGGSRAHGAGVVDRRDLHRDLDLHAATTVHTINETIKPGRAKRQGSYPSPPQHRSEPLA